MRPRKWTKEDLVQSVKTSSSIRQVLSKLGLKEAGGNYSQIQRYISDYKIDAVHLKGRGWNKGMKLVGKPRIEIQEILKRNSHFQSFKLKRRLLNAGLKKPECEICGWHKKSIDGRLPLEIHHINGDSHDNRIENLIILCPNCHSLEPNYRGQNHK